jgi:hypothetical protein
VDETLDRDAGSPLFGHGEESSDPVAAHRDHRVDGEVHGQPVAGQRHGHAVDQEGHVVVDDFDDRVRRLPAVPVDFRVVDADERGLR